MPYWPDGSLVPAVIACFLTTLGSELTTVLSTNWPHLTTRVVNDFFRRLCRSEGFPYYYYYF